jgi:nucleoside triphosphate diphosphatase
MASPSIQRAHDLQADAAAVGFDWPDAEDMLAKLDEEITELRQAMKNKAGPGHIQEEFGDIVFVLVNLARRLGISVESALDACSDKFERRFAHIETELARRGLLVKQVGLAEMEALWDEAKRLERGQP